MQFSGAILGFLGTILGVMLTIVYQAKKNNNDLHARHIEEAAKNFADHRVLETRVSVLEHTQNVQDEAIKEVTTTLHRLELLIKDAFSEIKSALVKHEP